MSEERKTICLCLEQIIQKILEWITARGNTCTLDELKQFLQSLGFLNDYFGEIDSIIGMLSNHGFSILNDIVTYRGLDYVAPIAPNQN